MFHPSRLLVCVLVLGGSACSGTNGSGSPKGNEDAGGLVISVPDAGGCHQSADAAVSIDDGGVDPQCATKAPAISFATDVMPILRACTGEICHAPWSYDTLVGQRSTVCCDRRWLVAPGQPSASHVVQALTNVGACVPQMPLDEGSLSQPEIATIIAWVCQGALDN